MLQIPKKIKILLTVLCLAVILLLCLFFGWNSGRNISQASLIYSNAQQIAAGLENFYKDQNRFPSAAEFANNNFMGGYFNIFPVTEVVVKNCSGNFVYKRLSIASYELDFCLPASVGAFHSGWNSAIINK